MRVSNTEFDFFKKKAGALTLLVFIWAAQTNGTLSIKLLSRAS